MALDRKLVTDNERTLFALGAAWSGVCWLMLAISLVGFLYGIPLALGFWIAQALLIARLQGNAVRVSPQQLPELHASAAAAAAKLGLPEVPAVYLVQSDGLLNAFAAKLFSRKFVVLFSALVDECRQPSELDFIIGHEMGHLAAGHLSWNGFLLPFRMVPWLGAAYSRAKEYTADRCGLEVTGELEPACRALTVLAAGGTYAAQVDLASFAEQRRESGSFWMATLELVSSHPYLCKRVAALQELREPGSAPVVARTALAYPLAPLFGIMSGGASAAPLAVVGIVGLMAAVAIPSFISYQQKARSAVAGRSDRHADDETDATAKADAAQREQVELAMLMARQQAEQAEQEAQQRAKTEARYAPAAPPPVVLAPAPAPGPARPRVVAKANGGKVKAKVTHRPVGRR